MIKVKHEFEKKSRRHRIVIRATGTEGPWFEYDLPAFLVDDNVTYVAFTRFFEADLSVAVETPYQMCEVD